MDPIVIVGSGLAGYTVAREVRKLDRATPLTLVTSDAGDFYSKPMLSNAFALGKSAHQLVTTPATTMAVQLNANLIRHTRVERIDTADRAIATSAGRLAYSRLVLAMGADPIRLTLGGDASGEVMSVNDLADYAVFRERLAGARQVAIIGAGLIGSEFANDLAGAGFAVTVIDPMPYPLANLVPEPVGRAVETALHRTGVAWRFGRGVEKVDRAGCGYHLTLDDGTTVEADLVLSAVGLRPRIALAREAGLAVSRGIVVDACLRTSAEQVFALGDCAEIDGQLRPYVMPIMHATKALAQTLTGHPTEVLFPPMPVLVKTSACPVAVCPVARDATGTWSGDAEEGNVRMRFFTPEGHLTGFALAGSVAAAERNAMAQALVP